MAVSVTHITWHGMLGTLVYKKLWRLLKYASMS